MRRQLARPGTNPIPLLSGNLVSDAVACRSHHLTLSTGRRSLTDACFFSHLGIRLVFSSIDRHVKLVSEIREVPEGECQCMDRQAFLSLQHDTAEQ